MQGMNCVLKIDVNTSQQPTLRLVSYGSKVQLPPPLKYPHLIVFQVFTIFAQNIHRLYLF